MTQVCSPEPNRVVLPEFRPSPPTNPDPSSIGPESWARAERATRDIVSKIQPTTVTHRRRKDIIQYVQSLITCNVGCQVITSKSFLSLPVFQSCLVLVACNGFVAYFQCSVNELLVSSGSTTYSLHRVLIWIINFLFFVCF